MRTSLSRHRSIQSQLNVPYYMALLAETLLEAGQIDDGLEVTEDALQVEEQTQQRSFLAEIYRLRGEILSSRDRADPVAIHCIARATRLRNRSQRVPCGCERLPALSGCRQARLPTRRGLT
jgi:predicted ATPase